MAKDQSKSVVLSWKFTLLKLQYVHGILIKKRKKRRQINIASQRTNMSNAIIYTHNIQRKAEWKTTHEQSNSHYQTINSYRSILISIQTEHQTINSYRSVLISIQTGYSIHIIACIYMHDFTHTRMHRWASAHICRHICVYGTHIYLQIQTPIDIF